jgi:hypothetical protein
MMALLDTGWHPMSNGVGPRNWYVTRRRGGQTEIYSDSRNNYRRYASFNAAFAAAKRLHQEDGMLLGICGREP